MDDDDERKSTREEVSDASVSLGDDMKGAMGNIVKSVVTCDGSHPVQNLKYVGTLEINICADAQCAAITAKCTHQIPIPKEEDSKPRKYTRSACAWNADGTVLTCTFCGVDGT